MRSGNVIITCINNLGGTACDLNSGVQVYGQFYVMPKKSSTKLGHSIFSSGTWKKSDGKWSYVGQAHKASQKELKRGIMCWLS